MACAYMPAQPEIVVALHAEHVELIKRRIGSRSPAANTPESRIIVAAGLREPMRFQRCLQFVEGLARLRPEASGLGIQAAGDGEALLRRAPKLIVDLRDLLELPARREQLRRQRCAGKDIAVIAMRDLNAGGPLPA